MFWLQKEVPEVYNIFHSDSHIQWRLIFLTDFIDKRLQSLVNTENLVKQCDLIGLTKYINTNQSQGLFVAPKTKTETFTAVLGAIYLDSGRDLKQVRAVMKTLGFGIEDLHG